MNIKQFKFISSLLVLLLFYQIVQVLDNLKKLSHLNIILHLIKENIKKSGQSEIAKTLEMGPKPVFGDTTN